MRKIRKIKEPVQLSLLDRLDAIKTHEARHAIHGVFAPNGIDPEKRPVTLKALKKAYRKAFERRDYSNLSPFGLYSRMLFFRSYPEELDKAAPKHALEQERVDKFFAAIEEFI